MNDRPRLLDLFCGAGGSAVGYHRAGFDIVGVDNRHQKRYPFEFHQADALEFVAEHGHEFDAIHASPPCQAYTIAQNAARRAHLHPDLVAATRDAIIMTGKPYMIENVPGAPLHNPVTICGLALGLRVKRHRLFESNVLILVPPCPSHDTDYFVIFGNEVRIRRTGKAAGRKNSIRDGCAAMGIDWMTRAELSQAIPPAYTELVGRQLLSAVRYTADAEVTP